MAQWFLDHLTGTRAEYVAADKFIVISFSDDGTPNDIAFLVVKCAGENDYYTRVERHYFTNGQSDD